MNEERINEIHADALNRKDSIDPEKMMKDHQLFQDQYASPNEIIRIIENQSFWKIIFSEENFSMEPMVKDLDFGGSDVIHYKFY